MADTYTDRLADLEALWQEAHGRYTTAQDEYWEGRKNLVASVTADLVKLHDAIAFKRPGAPPKEERSTAITERSRATLQAILDAGLEIVPYPSHGQMLLLLHDPLADTDETVTALAAEAADLSKQVEDFRRDHAADLERERQEAEADAYREALAANNLEAARQIFNRDSGNGVFTTADLA